MLPHVPENNAPVNNLFDLPVEDILFSLNNNSSDDDDDNRLLIGKLLNKTYSSHNILHFTINLIV